MPTRAVAFRSWNIIALITLAFSVTGCSDQGATSSGSSQSTESAQRTKPPSSVSVIAEPVTLLREQVTLQSVGTSKARRSVTIYPHVTGTVETVTFSSGDQVKAGQILLQMENRQEQLAVNIARVNLEDAQRLYNRYRQSVESGAVTSATYDESSSDLERRKIELDQAREALADTVIRAPFNGFVGISQVDPGARINPDTAITTLDDRAELFVDFMVPEDLIDTLATGDIVTMIPWNQPGRTINGEVRLLGSRIDPQNRTFVARAVVPNTEDRLRPGMSFRVTLRRLGAEFPTVPEVAVQWGGSGSFVWVIRNNRASAVPVSIVQRNQGRVLVDGELDADSLVVTRGLQNMREGRPVKLLEHQDTPVSVVVTSADSSETTP